jgi:hypothetical protein
MGALTLVAPTHVAVGRHHTPSHAFVRKCSAYLAGYLCLRFTPSRSKEEEGSTSALSGTRITDDRGWLTVP